MASWKGALGYAISQPIGQGNNVLIIGYNVYTRNENLPMLLLLLLLSFGSSLACVHVLSNKSLLLPYICMSCQTRESRGPPWWLCGLWQCHWLQAVSHQWGPTSMADWSMALSLGVSFRPGPKALNKDCGHLQKIEAICHWLVAVCLGSNPSHVMWESSQWHWCFSLFFVFVCVLRDTTYNWLAILPKYSSLSLLQEVTKTK